MSGQYLSTFDSTMEKWNHFIEVPPSPSPWPRRNIKIYDRPHVPYSASSHPISSWYEINFYEQFAFPLLRFIGRLKSYWNKCRVSSQRIIFENIGFRDRPGKRERLKDWRHWNLINLAINEQVDYYLFYSVPIIA